MHSVFESGFSKCIWKMIGNHWLHHHLLQIILYSFKHVDAQVIDMIKFGCPVHCKLSILTANIFLEGIPIPF